MSSRAKASRSSLRAPRSKREVRSNEKKEIESIIMNTLLKNFQLIWRSLVSRLHMSVAVCGGGTHRE